jgi:UDP-galactopyranose mutase
MKKYDYLVVGSGLFGSVFAHEASKLGKKVLVLEKRDHPGGNIYCENIEGINVHKYGAHIFHTNDDNIWEYVNQFVKFNSFINSPMACFEGEIYNLPFNMNTFSKMWNIKTPSEARERIKSEIENSGIKKPSNLEEQAISLVGTTIYEKLIKGYTEKQWGRSCKDLPPFIIKRLPVRFTYDNNYFNDKYQGIPIGGYNKLIDGLLEGVEVKLSTDYMVNRKKWDALATKIVFTGKIDEFYGYVYGKLNYHSLRFETVVKQDSNYQGVAVVNYTERNVPHTRILEHKHFEFVKSPSTVITYEYPEEWQEGSEPYYPVNDDTNMDMYRKYKKMAESETGVIFGGRLAEYKYYDMHQVIASALNRIKKEFKR